MRLVWTPRYLKELGGIGDYIAGRNPRAATKVVRVIHQTTARLLSANPYLGQLVISGLPYIVAYRVTDRQIEVLFVQHAAREWPDEA
ncbi:Toxin RelE2 [compost metagenome]